jgi:hypothetical protein
MAFDPNSLFYYMAKTYSQEKSDSNKIIFCNEGSSRSSKTQDAFHLIEVFCDHNRKTPLKIGVFRNTLKDCREKTFDDFKTFLVKIRGIYDPNNSRGELSSPTYNLYGSIIEFRGLEEDTEQKGYDIVFVNEALEIDTETKINGLKMRCKKLMIFDWNPKYTQHWIFSWEGRPNVYFTKTTYKNNKHLEYSIIADIESKSPWHLDDLELPKDKRRPHEENIKNKTVDEWYFEVYGMGIRANKSGLVFPNVAWIGKLPTNINKHFYGLDFGNTTGTFAFSQGCYNDNGIHLDCPIYGSFATQQDIALDSNSGLKNFWNTLKLWIDNEGLKEIEMLVICDSAKPNYITDLNNWSDNEGYSIKFAPCKKFNGCVTWRIDVAKRHQISLVNRPHIKIEQENYAYNVIHGISTNEPKHSHNHFFDAAMMSVQYEEYLRT